MSWSVQVSGKASALPAKVDEIFNQYKCGDNYPVEQSVKDAVRDVIKSALTGCEPSRAYQITASGSASAASEDAKTYKETGQNVSLKMEEIYNFVE